MALQNIRERTNRILMWAFLILFLISFLAIGNLGNYMASSGARVIASVDGDKIYPAQVLDKARNMMAEAKEHMGGITNDKQADYLKNALDKIIGEKIEYAIAKKLDLAVPDYKVAKIITSSKKFFIDGEFSRQKYLEELHANGYTDAMYRKLLAHSLIINQLHEGIYGSSFATDRELREYVKTINQKYEGRYLQLDVDSFKKAAEPSETEIQNYYHDNVEKMFSEPQKIKLEYLVLAIKDLMPKVKVTEQQIVEYYNENKSNYKKIDPVTKKETMRSLKEVRENIISQITYNEAEKMWSDLNEELHDLAFANPNSLEPIAKALHLPLKVSNAVTVDGSFNDASIDYKNVFTQAFSNKVLKEGENSEVLSTEKDTSVVVRLKELVPSRHKDLIEVHDAIKSILVTEKAAKMTKEHALQLVKELNNSQDLALKYKYKWLDLAKIDNSFPAWKIKKMHYPTQKPTVGMIKINDNKYAVVVLTKIIDTNIDDLPGTTRTFQDQMLINEISWNEYNNLINSLKRYVKINREIDVKDTMQ